MKKLIKSTLFPILVAFPVCAFPQDNPTISTVTGGEYVAYSNDANTPCIAAEQYAMMDKNCAENIKRLGLVNRLNKTTLSTSLAWPLKLASGINDCGYHFIGAYVDQNTTASAIKDFNCGSNTYDGHRGTDIAIWPYSFYKVDNNHVEVRAAAAGTIIDKHDGEFDRNCVGVGSGLMANYVIVQHDDGSQALYWHMKKNSITTKAIGLKVTEGEYIGVVASSGSSSGPHLHFEVHSSSTSSSYIDPFYGSCNTLNSSTWWTSQRPHSEPAVIKVSVNITDAVMPPCPTTETPNESNSYTIPFQGPGLSPGYAKFYIFMRDIPSGTNIDLKILNPDGSTFNSWVHNVTALNKVSYWHFSKKLPTSAGKYVFQSTFNAVTCSKSFDIVASGGSESMAGLVPMQIFPNPGNAKINIAGDGIPNGNYSFNLLNTLGKSVYNDESTVQNNTLHKMVSIAELPNGIYFLTIESGKSRIVKKIIKQD